MLNKTVVPASQLDTVRRIVRQVQLQADELELIIFRVPTGPVRNTLTAANIDLLAAISALTKVS